MHARHLFAAALLSGVGLLATRDARACAPSLCTAARIAPPPASAPVSVPANALALSYAIWEATGSTLQTLHVLDGAGSEIATTTKNDPWSPGIKLVGFAAPLAVGSRYHLDYVETCTGSSPSNTNESRAFAVGPAVPLPTSMGAAHGAGRFVGPTDVATASGSCYATIEAVSIDVRVTPSMELLAYANIAGFKVQVDGLQSTTALYGTAKPDADGLVVAKLHAACGKREGFNDNGLTLGVHTVSVQAHVAGAATDPPPVTTVLNFSCTDDVVELDAGVPDDAGKQADAAADANTPLYGDYDGGAVGDQVLAADNGGSGCACTATGKNANEGYGGYGAFALMACALTLKLRAKRRGRSQSKH